MTSHLARHSGKGLAIDKMCITNDQLPRRPSQVLMTDHLICHSGNGLAYVIQLFLSLINVSTNEAQGRFNF